MSSAYDGPAYDPDRRPFWILAPAPKGLGLICPHCKCKSLVNRTQWLQGRIPSHYEYQEIFRELRSCPYCTQLARIPLTLRRRRK